MAIQAISGISAANTLASTLSVSSQTNATSKTGGAAPAGKAGGGGGGAPKAKSASSSSSSSSSDTKIYDKMDTNKDGTVSAQEKAAYLIIHPEEATENTDSINYNGQGSPSEDQGGLSAIINLYA